LSEILTPIRKSFEESGMTEEELDVLIEELREGNLERMNGEG
jgi:hypothetical protein